MPTPTTTLPALQLVTPALPAGTTVLSVDSSVLPFVINGDPETYRVEVGLYNTTYATDESAAVSYTGLTGATVSFNQFLLSPALVPSVQETSVNIIGRNYDPNNADGGQNPWRPSYAYPLGYRYLDSNGFVQEVTYVGTVVPLSGTAQPAFNPAPGGTTYDPPSAAPPTTTGLVWTNKGQTAVTPVIKFSLLYYQTGLAASIGPPSAISALKNQNDCTLQWATPEYPGFIGVRVMISTDPAGVNPPYIQYGDLVTKVSSTASDVVSSTTATAVDVPAALITGVEIANNVLTVVANNTFGPGSVVQLSGLVNAEFLDGTTVTVVTTDGAQLTADYTANDYPLTPDTGEAISVVSTNVTTSTDTVILTDYSSVDIPFTFVNSNVFYAMFSTVVQDPHTSAVFESVQNGPLTCGFVNLRIVNPTDFPVLQRKEDIAGRLIGQIVRQQPDLDLSPRSEIRDLFVDPFSIECANMSVREWFARVSSSISAISQVDDANNDGVSDPFQSSQYKQQIARAYGLSSTDTQNLIDEQFDILGEQAGLTRGGANASTVVVTFYTYQQPQASITIPQGAVVASIGDSTTPSLTFTTLGQGTIDLVNLASFYNATQGYWAISVPAQCNQVGSVGNVGAGTIQQPVSGVPTGVNVNNLSGATFGTDQESNSAFAARIQARLVTGIDSSSRHGILVAALSTPSIIGAQVVAAGDLEMVRDWDPTRQKHVFGTVDVYVRGTTLSQQNSLVPFVYEDSGVYASYSTYTTLARLAGTNLFQLPNFSPTAVPPYDAVELLVTRSTGSFYLGLDRSQFYNATGVLALNGGDPAYQYAGNSVTRAKVPLLLNGFPATNQQALQALASSTPGTYTFQLFFRLKSPFSYAPTLQPVLQVYAVTGGATGTGGVPSDDIELIHTSDFLLTGGSNEAGDTVKVPLTSSPVTAVLTTSLGSTGTFGTLIDIGMDVPVDPNGVPTSAAVLSVRSLDSSTLYTYGVDYSVVPCGPYHQYGLKVLTSAATLTAIGCASNVLTVTVPHDFGPGSQVTISGVLDPVAAPIFATPQTVVISTVTGTAPNYTGFTAVFGTDFTTLTPTTSGLVTGSAIDYQNGQQVVVAYNKFVLYERLSYVQGELQVLNGTVPTVLDNDGFVSNTWLPESYTTGVPSYPLTQTGYMLTLDGWDGLYGADGGLDIPGSLAAFPSGLVGNQVPHDQRYIKVTYNNGVKDVVMKEGIDFNLGVDPTSGQASLTRVVPAGRIPDGGTVSVSYFCTETFTVATQYPTFVETLANSLALTKAAGADILVKAMVANPVDITLAVTLLPSTSPETIDPVIRTVINIALDNAVTTLYQSALIQQIQNVVGVQSVEVPLIKCAKANGSYDIGTVIPTGTSWTPLHSDPAFAGISVPPTAWISTGQILADSTLPSGGEQYAIVDLLYEGQVFARALSLGEFLSHALVPQALAVPPGVTDAPPGSFYIIGTSDPLTTQVAANLAAAGIDPSTYWRKVVLTIPQDVPNPGNLAYFCTYQVWDEGGARDVTVSSTEYLSPGLITINYVTAG